MFSQAVESFLNEIDLPATRVVALPKIILVLGGPVNIQPDHLYISNRNVFITKMGEKNDELSPLLRMPEDYPEWNQFNGYPHLVDFERDAGSLTRAILLFSESAGAIAELATFADDPRLCERLLAVFSKRHYDGDSFIRHGPIRQIEAHSEDSICVVLADAPTNFATEVDDVADALRKKWAAAPKTSKFDGARRRDRFLLLADLLDLFCALNLAEITSIFEKLSFAADRIDLERELKLLEMFGLVVSSTSDRRFYVAPPGSARQSFLNYKARVGAANFDRSRHKTKSYTSLQGDRPRLKAYQLVHGIPAA